MALRGWQEYRIGMSYFAAISLMAVNRLTKLASVSIFSSLWAESRMYLPFSSPSRAWMSEAAIFVRLARSTSAMGEPVT